MRRKSRLFIGSRWFVITAIFTFAVVRDSDGQATQPSGARAKEATLLKPFKAIICDKVSCTNSSFDWGDAVAKNPGDTLVGVYFSGFSGKTRISGDDLKWLARHEKRGNFSPIGLFAATNDTPAQIIGVIPHGAWISLQGSSEPLLCLVFVVPKGAKELVLTDPVGSISKLALSNDWAPKKQNLIDSYTCSEIEFTGPLDTDLWTTKPQHAPGG